MRIAIRTVAVLAALSVVGTVLFVAPLAAAGQLGAVDSILGPALCTWRPLV